MSTTNGDMLLHGVEDSIAFQGSTLIGRVLFSVVQFYLVISLYFILYVFGVANRTCTKFM